MRVLPILAFAAVVATATGPAVAAVTGDRAEIVLVRGGYYHGGFYHGGHYRGGFYPGYIYGYACPYPAYPYCAYPYTYPY
jgi:hypothetical protein